MASRSFGRRLALVALALATLAVAGAPRPAHARGGARDPFAQWEQHRHDTERRKSRRREELDLRGAEERDAKKSAEDSRQSEQLKSFGTPNQQDDRWGAY